MFTVIILIIVLAVLIFVHELGHFLLARWNGIRVDAFKLGFGTRLISWKRGETEYGLNLVPLGGYVKIFGENPDAESTTGADSSRSFVNKNRFQQVLVLAAGVFFNFLFAWILYSIVFMTGVTATTDGFEKYADNFSDRRVMVTYVAPASPAEKGGMKVGDVIKSIGSVTLLDPVVPSASSSAISSIQNTINISKGEVVHIGLIRGQEDLTVDVTPITGIVDDKFAIGIAMQDVGDMKLPVFASITQGFGYTIAMIRDTAIGLYTFVLNIFRGTANFADVAGPVGIAGIVGNAAELGFTYLLMITALISINLGVINLLPFPALDGGRIVMVLIEGVIRRRIPSQFANAVNALGFIALMLLMVVVTYKDILKLIN